MEDRPKQVWVYDKLKDKTYLTSVERAAKERGFYTPEVETDLAERVEGPAEPLLEKLCAGQLLDPKEKWKIAEYISIMKKRGHDHRMKAEALIPEMQEKTLTDLETEIMELPDSELRKRHLEDLARLREDWKDSLPDDVRTNILQPWVTPEFVEVVFGMRWLYLRCAGSQKLVSCDNPFFYFTDTGIKDPNSGFSIPLSSDLALMATTARFPDQGFYEASDRRMREINRRSISNATRFVYFSEKVDWIPVMLRKRTIQLTRYMVR